MVHRPPFPEFNSQLAVSVAEQAALSFANLKLREKLRVTSPFAIPLRGLFNRRYLDESLELASCPAQSGKPGLGIIMLDMWTGSRSSTTSSDTMPGIQSCGNSEIIWRNSSFAAETWHACYGGERYSLWSFPSLPWKTHLHRRAEELRIAFQQMSIKHRDIVLGKVTCCLWRRCVAAFPFPENTGQPH